jgi:guanylate kinase
VSGPSGAGKTTLVDELIQADRLLKGSVSATTRPPREGEVEGEDYFFKDKAIFETMKSEELIEWAEVYGYLYGTPRQFVDRQLEQGYDPVLNIDVQGGISVKKAFPNAVLIFILPPSYEELEKRIRSRGAGSKEEIQRRLDCAQRETEMADAYDYIVINDKVEQAVARLKIIVEAERCRKERFTGHLPTFYGN